MTWARTDHKTLTNMDLVEYIELSEHSYGESAAVFFRFRGEDKPRLMMSGHIEDCRRYIEKVTA